MKTLIIIWFCLGFSAAAELPPFVKRCTRCQDVSTCIRNNLELAKPFIVDGIPEFSIPSLRPFVIPDGSTGVPGFKFSVWNVNLTGFDDMLILDVSADLQNNIYKVEVVFPAVSTIGNCEMKGNLLNTNFDTYGILRGHATNLRLVYNLKTDRYIKNGKEYLRIVNQSVKSKLDGDMELIQEHFHHGHSQHFNILDIIGRQNTQYFFGIIVQILEKEFAKVLDHGLNIFFALYSHEELFGITKK